MKKIIVLILIAAIGTFAFLNMKKTEKLVSKKALKIDKVKKGNVIFKIDCTGRVVSNFEVEIKSKASGEIIELPFDVSAIVKKNDLLVKLDPVDEQRNRNEAKAEVDIANAELNIIDQKIKIAKQELEILKKNIEAQIEYDTQIYKDAVRKEKDAKRLYPKQVMSEGDYEDALSLVIQSKANLQKTLASKQQIQVKQLEIETLKQQKVILQKRIIQKQIKLNTAQRKLDDTQIIAPMDGIVTSRNVQKGQIISSGISNVGGGTTILTLSDLSSIFVIASVDESDIGKVKLEQDVMITVDAFPYKNFKGKVVQIGAKGINSSNVVIFEVKIEILGKQKKLLKPEMTANIAIIQKMKKDVLIVDSDSLIYEYGKYKVEVPYDKEQKKTVEVKVGLDNGTVAQIIKGLKEGQEIVIQTDNIKSKWERRSNSRRAGRMMRSAGRNKRKK